MRSRRRKSSPAKYFFLWMICLALVGWGFYQADQFRRALPAVSRQDAPPGAISSETVTADDPPDGVSPTNLSQTALLPALSPESLAGDTADTAPVDMRTYPTFDAALSAEDLFSQGKQLLDSGQIVAGRFALNAALARISDDGRAQQLRTLLSDLNVPIFLGSAVLSDDPAARLVDIQADDTFLKIASTYGLTAGLLQTLNPSLAARDLKPHTGIKIVQGPLHARIVKHDHRLDLFARDLFVTSLRVDFPEGNYLPRGDYKVSAGTKLQLGPFNSLRTWIGFHGVEDATEQVESGWIFGSAGPRGHTTRDLATGVQLSDSDMQTLFVTLTEGHSHVRVEP